MANNFSPLGDELQVNLAPNQDFDQDEADVASLTDGRFLVAFADQDAGDILGQFFNADGTFAGTNINLEIDVASLSGPAVAARLGGAAIVVWEENGSADIRYTTVSGAGVAGASQLILDAGLGFLDAPDVATLADGRSLVVAGGEDVVFRFVDAAGNPIGLQDFLDNGPDEQFNPAVAAFGSNALVVYSDALSGFTDIKARFFDGTAFAAEVVITTTPDSEFTPDVAALSDGRFVVVWEDGATDDILARFVSAAGVPLGSAFAISQGGGFDFSARVAALPDGGFIVTWVNEGASVGGEVAADSEAVLARRFDSTGAPVGDLFLVNTADPLTNQRDPAVAANVAGQAFITWQDRHAFAGADNEPDGVRGRAFLATTDIVNGTAGDDIIQTYNLGETVNGLDGDDVIVTFGGDDTVLGGAGVDHLKGGLGNDQLFGGDGDDLLKGEDGDDLLVGSGGYDELQGGLGNDRLFGEGRDDELYGGDGNDLLTGGLGSDVQLGGAGQDTFDFNRVAESRVGANRDLIQGFKHSEHDRIDLKTIDADTTAGGNQAFDLIGAAAFSGAAGELRFAAGLLQADTNGDGIANFEIKVGGLGAAVNGDFVL